MGYQTIIVEKSHSSRYVTLNRVKQDNKLSILCMKELTDVLENTRQDPTCRVVVLTGKGSYFCAGGELGDFRKKQTQDIRDFGEAFIKLHLTICNLDIPVIAAVQGHAFGGGLSLVEACDLAIGGKDILLAIPEILDGLAPAMGMSGIYAQMGKKKVMELGLLGHKMTAAEALDFGMLNEVVEPNRVWERALELAEQIAEFSPTSVRMFKELYRQMGFGTYGCRLEYGKGMMIALLKSQDGWEKLQAEEESRKPVWTGR